MSDSSAVVLVEESCLTSEWMSELGGSDQRTSSVDSLNVSVAAGILLYELICL